MQEVSTTATLVEPAAFEGGISTVLSRREIEEALEADAESFALWFDLASGEDQARLTLELTPAEAEQLLRDSAGDEVTVALGGAGLASLFEDPDVEAHGLREAAVLIGVVAIGATAGASQAGAMPIMDVGGGSAPVALAGSAGAAGTESPAATTGGAGIASTASTPTVYSDAIDRAVSVREAATPDAVDRAVAIDQSIAPDAVDRAVAVQASQPAAGGAVAAAGDESPASVTGGATGAAIGGAAGAAGLDSPAATTGGAVPSAGIGGAVAAAGDESPAATTGGAGAQPVTLASGDSGFELNAPSAGEAALIGGLALLITGAGVVAARGGRRGRPATP
jgi:hypothetical protein